MAAWKALITAWSRSTNLGHRFEHIISLRVLSSRVCGGRLEEIIGTRLESVVVMRVPMLREWWVTATIMQSCQMLL